MQYNQYIVYDINEMCLKYCGALNISEEVLVFLCYMKGNGSICFYAKYNLFL